MKKEKTIRTYQRRTKSGKVVTVKQHTAKYDAAEALKEAAKKKGAGDELETLKKKKLTDGALSAEEIDELEYPLKDINAVAKALGLTQREAASWMEGPDFSGYRKADMAKGDKAAKKYLGDDVFSKLDPSDADAPLAVLAKIGKKLGGSKFLQARDLVNSSKAPKTEKSSKSASSDYGFTADEYKAWYHWDQEADPKNKTALKVEKALKKQMGTKAYNKYFDEVSDNYSTRGHNKAFKSLGDTFSTGDDKKSVTSGKEKAKKEVSSDTKVSKEESAKLKKAAKEQSDYVKHLMRLHKDGVKDKQMGGYIAAEKQILEDLKKPKGSLKSNGELSDTEEAYAKKNKLRYEEDGMYSSKDGKIYRISVHPITGVAKAHPLTGNTMGATKAQLRAAGLKGDDYDTVDYDKSSDIIWGSKSKKSSKEKEAHASLKEKGYKKYTYNGEVYYATKSGSLKQVGSDGKVHNVVPFKGAKGTQESALIGWKRRKSEEAKAKRDKEDAKKYRESLKSKDSSSKVKAGKQKIAQLKEKGYALVRTGATGSYYAKKGSRTVYNLDGTKAIPSQAEYALAKLAGRKPRRLR